MKVFVKAKPNAKQEKVARSDAVHFEIWVKEPAKQGRANHAVLVALAGHFNVPLSRVRLVSGVASRSKVVEIE